MALFESYERRIDKINAVLNSYGIASLEEAEKITKDAGLDVYNQIKGIQPICFENACWAYIVGAAIAIKKGCRKAADAAAAITGLFNSHVCNFDCVAFSQGYFYSLIQGDSFL